MNYELTHDTIAKQVYQKASTEARTRRKVERYVRERYAAYQERGAKLTQDDVDFVTPYLAQINISQEEANFIAYAQKQLTAKRRNIRLLVIAIVTALLGLATWAIINGNEAELNAIAAKENADEANAKAKALEIKEVELSTSLLAAQEARDTAEIRRILAEIAQAAADQNAEEAQRQRRSAEDRTRDVKMLGIAGVAAALSPRQMPLSLRLLETLSEKGGKELPEVSQALMETFYQQNEEEDRPAYPLYSQSLTHTSEVNSVRFSRDGSKVLTGSINGLVQLWDVDSGALLNTWSEKLVDDRSRIGFIEFSPDGKWIVYNDAYSVKYHALDGSYDGVNYVSSGGVLRTMFSNDGSKILGVAKSGLNIRNLKGESLLEIEKTDAGNDFSFACFSPDDQQIWAGFQDGSIQCFSAQDGQLLKAWEPHNSYVHWMAFSPDDDRFISLENSGDGYIWSLEGDLLLTLEDTRFANWSPDGKYFFTGDRQGNLKLWQKDGTAVFSRTAHSNYIRFAAFSPNGKKIMTASGDGDIKVWDLDGNQTHLLAGHTEDIRSARFSPDGKYLVSGSIDKTCKIWPLDGALLEEVESNNDWFSLVDYFPKGDYLVTQKNGNLDIRSRTGEFIVDVGYRNVSKSHKVLLLHEDEKVFVLNETSIKVYNFEGEETVNFKPSNSEQKFFEAFLSENKNSVIVISKQGQIYTWTIGEEELKQVADTENTIYQAKYAPTQDVLCVVGDVKGVQVYDLNGQLISSIPTDDPRKVDEIAFAPDGKSFLLAHENKLFSYWSIGGKLINTWSHQINNINQLEFLPDDKGNRFVSMSSVDSLVIWNTNGYRLHTLDHRGTLDGFEISPCGDMLLSINHAYARKRSLRLWDLKTVRLNYEWHKEYTFAKFTGDCQNIITEQKNGSAIEFWPLPNRINNYLKNEAAIPELTTAQKQQYGIE